MKRIAFILTLGLLLALVLVGPAVLAQSGYDLSWWTVDGGGGVSQSADGTYSVHGTIGQPDAGAPLSGGDYSLTGGFWGAGVSAGVDVFLPLVVR
jgi:hypothetical protein